MRPLGWIFYCLLLVIGQFLYNLCFPSIINGERFLGDSLEILEPSYIHAFFRSRIEFAEFARRPLTSLFIQAIESLGVPLEYAFLIAIFSGYFLAILLLYRLALLLTKSHRASAISTLLFTSSISVLHALFSQIYAYDEAIQYVFLFGSLIFLEKSRFWLFSIFFLMACIARESSLLLLPGLLLFFMIDKPIWRKKNLINGLKVIWIVPVYGAILALILNSKNLLDETTKYTTETRGNHLQYSFADLDIGIDTFTSLIAAILIPLFLMLIQHRCVHSKIDSDRKWVYSTLLNLGVNVLIAIPFTMGRETRILAQPMLLLAPWLGLYSINTYRYLREKYSEFELSFDNGRKLLAGAILLIGLIFCASIYSYEVYWPTDTRFFHGFQHHVYLQLSLVIVLSAMVLLPLQKGKQSDPKLWFTALFAAATIGFFFNNQHGYRFYDDYESINVQVQNIEKNANTEATLIVSTTMANNVEEFFRNQDQAILAADFNSAFAIDELFDQESELKGTLIHFHELEPCVNYPLKFILSRWGKVIRKDSQSITIDTEQKSDRQLHEFNLLDSAITFSEEYSPSIKLMLNEIDLDSVYSLAGMVEFQATAMTEAILVVSIKEDDSQVFWESIPLKHYHRNESGWNTAFIAKSVNSRIGADAEIAYYVFNPDGESIEIRDLHLIINSDYLNQSVDKRSVLSSRKLR